MDAEKLSIDVEAETGEAEAELTGFALKTEALITALNALTAEIKINADTGSLRPKVTAATKAAGAGQEINVPVKTSGMSSLMSSLKGLGSRLTSVGGSAKNFRKSMMLMIVPVVVAAINVAIGALGALGVAALGAASTLGAMGGVLATLPGLFGGLIAGIGGLMGAFKPVTGALKAFKQQETSATKASAGGAKATEAAAKKREAAAKAVERATRSLAKAQQDSAKGVADATERIAEAEEKLSDAQRDARDAQDDLTRARQKAAETYEDLQFAAEAAALAEQRARLRLLGIQQKQAAQAGGFAANMTANSAQQADAIRRLQASQEGLGQSELERQDAALDLAEAELGVRTAVDERLEAEERLLQAQQKGIEGDDRVVAAHRQVEDASRNVIRANKDLQDSHEAVTEAQVEGAERVRDAQEALADAMENMADAAEDAGAAGAAAFKPFDDAMSKLSPLGREMVQVLLSFKGPLKIMREAIEQAAFPDIIKGLTNIKNFLPTLTPLIAGAAKEIGGFFLNWTELVTSPAFSKDLVTFGESNNRVLKDLGKGFIGLTDAFMSIVTAAAPLTEWLAKLFATFGENLAVSMNLKQESGQLAATFLRVREATALWFHNLKQIVGVFWDILKAAFPMGMELGKIFKSLIDNTREWTSSAEGQKKMKDTFMEFVPLIRELGNLFLDLGKALGELSFENIKSTTDVSKDLRTGLIPALKDFFSSLRDMGPKVAEFFTTLTRLLEALPLSALGVFFVVLEGFMKLLLKLMEIPGVTEFISVLLAIKGALMAVGLIIKIVTPLWTILSTVFGVLIVPIKTLVVALLSLGAPVLLIIAAVALAAVLIWRHWDKVKAAFKAAWEFIKNIVGWVVDKVKELPGKILEGLTSFIESGKKIITGLWDGITGAADKVWDWFKEFAPKALKFMFPVASVVLWLKDHGMEILTGLWDGLQAAAGKVWDWFKEFGPKALKFMFPFATVGKWLWDHGKDIITGLWDGLEEGVKKVWDWFKGFKDRAIENFGRGLDVFKNLGKDIMQGLANGLEAGWDIVKKAWNWIIDKLPGDFANGLKMDSPSKVFMHMGEMITQGLAIGIHNGASEVISEVAALNRHLVAEGNMTATLGTTARPGALRPVSGQGGVNVGGITFNVDARGATDPQAVGAAVAGSGEDMVAELLRVIRSA